MHDRLQIFEGYVMRSRVYNLQDKVSARLPLSLSGLRFYAVTVVGCKLREEEIYTVTDSAYTDVVW